MANNLDSTDGTFPDYGDEGEIFERFMRNHEILTSRKQNGNGNDNDNNNNNNADDDLDLSNALLEPGTDNLYRIPAYKNLLQRIKDRRYYTHSQSKIFILEVPLDELIAWDAVRGVELANRATENAHRYHEVFCAVIDKVLDSMEESEDNEDDPGGRGHGRGGVGMHRDSNDVLLDHRIREAERHRAEQQAQALNNNDDGMGGDANANGEGVMNDAAMTNNRPGNELSLQFPPLLMRRYELRILPLGRPGRFTPFQYQFRAEGSFMDRLGGANGLGAAKNTRADMGAKGNQQKAMEGVSLRHIRSKSMGRLVTVRGMIVRTSDVKPCCTVATYSCDACGGEIYQVINAKREFMPQRICPTQACQGAGGAKDSLHLQTRGSKFEKFQEIKVQELPHQVPMGHVPRSMSVYCRGERTRECTPGDVVTIDGVFLPQRQEGGGYMARMNAGLISTTFLEAHNIIVHKKSYDDSLADALGEDDRKRLDDQIMDICTGDDPVGRLSSSIAPEIYGHGDIKRALLLQLVGGVTRSLPDGMRIRGDVNICLMGDPGVAKSQLLKHVSTTAPRGVYTTGKGSSGVGLTAAITKDLATGEMALEGGALVLADQGICCIDEFDKMDENDRTAIHEVMEQQTVSVAKAGIIATLNARAAVLAAANPLYGRYNRKKSMSENVNLPNSLLSRFDLMFLILDIADVDKDMALARHVTFVHQNEGLSVNKSINKNAGGRTPSAKPNTIEDDDTEDDDDDDDNDDDDDSKKTLPPEIVREYISRARKFQPVVPPEVAPYIVEAYVGLRMQGTPGMSRHNQRQQGGDQTVMTARQLLSILRLAQALARLRFSDYVAREDVDESIRLTHMSKASLLEDDYHDTNRGGANGGKRRDDVISRIFSILKDYSTASNVKKIEMKLCEAMVLRKGFTEQQFKTCLEEYEALSVIQLNNTGTQINFL